MQLNILKNKYITFFFLQHVFSSIFQLNLNIQLSALCYKDLFLLFFFFLGKSFLISGEDSTPKDTEEINEIAV